MLRCAFSSNTHSPTRRDSFLPRDSRRVEAHATSVRRLEAVQTERTGGMTC